MKRASLLLCLIVFSTSSIFAGDRGPSPFHQNPSRNPDRVVPEVQTDDFSCGYHALSAIYKSHDLDPKLARLRERLGTNVPAIPFIKDSTGTLQPDLLRVLQQDGFVTSSVDLNDHDNCSWMLKTIERGYHALVLIKTDKPGGMHWIVLSRNTPEDLVLLDSLKQDPQPVTLEELKQVPILSLIVLEPNEPRPGSPYYMAHASGTFGMLGTLWSISSTGTRVFLLLLLFLFAWLLKSLTQRLWRHIRRSSPPPQNP